MENKKNLPIKVIHLILMIASIILCCLSFTKIGSDSRVFSDTGLRMISYISEIIALISGIIYLAFGYKKNAAVYYKVFMVILVFVQSIICYRQMVGKVSPRAAITSIISLLMIAILATGKDLGKVKSYSIVSILLICRLLIVVFDINAFGAMPDTGFTIISFAISDVLLAGTTAFMVLGKYLDKEARGTK